MQTALKWKYAIYFLKNDKVKTTQIKRDYKNILKT